MRYFFGCDWLVTRSTARGEGVFADDAQRTKQIVGGGCFVLPVHPPKYQGKEEMSSLFNL